MAVEHMFENRLEGVVVDESGDVEHPTRRREQPNAVGPTHDIVLVVEQIRTVNLDAPEPGDATGGHHMHVVAWHVAANRQPASGWAADHKRWIGQACSHSSRFDCVLGGSDDVDALVDRCRKPDASKGAEL